MRDGERRVLQGNSDSYLRRDAAADGIWAEKHRALFLWGVLLDSAERRHKVLSVVKTRPSTASSLQCSANVSKAKKKNNL